RPRARPCASRSDALLWRRPRSRRRPDPDCRQRQDDRPPRRPVLPARRPGPAEPPPRWPESAPSARPWRLRLQPARVLSLFAARRGRSASLRPFSRAPRPRGPRVRLRAAVGPRQECRSDSTRLPPEARSGPRRGPPRSHERHESWRLRPRPRTRPNGYARSSDPSPKRDHESRGWRRAARRPNRKMAAPQGAADDVLDTSDSRYLIETFDRNITP